MTISVSPVSFVELSQSIEIVDLDRDTIKILLIFLRTF